MDVPTLARQSKNWIADQLARSVKRHLPSPANSVHRNATGIQHKAFVRSTSQGKDGRMFEQQERILAVSPTALLNTRLLQRQGTPILDQTQITTPQLHVC
jgi:hypothetical protein